MTQRDMAGILKVTPMTLRNWKKRNQDFMKLFKRLRLWRGCKKAQENADELKALEEKFKIKK